MGAGWGWHSPCIPSDMQEASLPRVFKLFRALGLRHLVVVNNRNEVSPARWVWAAGACPSALPASVGLYRVPVPAGGGHGHPQGPRQVPAGQGRLGGALAGTDVMWGGSAQRRETHPGPSELGPPFAGEAWASLCRHCGAWSTDTAVLPWLSCLLLPSHIYCLLFSPFPLLP